MIETGDVRPAERSRPSTAVEKLGDLPALTGLRFFAAFLILVGHGTPDDVVRLHPTRNW